MPRGKPRPLDGDRARDFSEGRESRAHDLAVRLARAEYEGDTRFATGRGRSDIYREMGISEGEGRRRLADARVLLASDEGDIAATLFKFGPKTVLMNGTRYRTARVSPDEVRADRLYATFRDGDLSGTFAGGTQQRGAPGSSSYWQRVRELIAQGYSSAEAIDKAAQEAEEGAQFEEELATGVALYELLGGDEDLEGFGNDELADQNGIDFE